MLAVPKLPMISFDLKTSPEAVSFQNLKQVITFNWVDVIFLYLTSNIQSYRSSNSSQLIPNQNL
jgi:hypothetical protein